MPMDRLRFVARTPDHLRFYSELQADRRGRLSRYVSQSGWVQLGAPIAWFLYIDS